MCNAIVHGGQHSLQLPTSCGCCSWTQCKAQIFFWVASQQTVVCCATKYIFFRKCQSELPELKGTQSVCEYDHWWSSNNKNMHNDQGRGVKNPPGQAIGLWMGIASSNICCINLASRETFTWGLSKVICVSLGWFKSLTHTHTLKMMTLLPKQWQTFRSALQAYELPED